MNTALDQAYLRLSADDADDATRLSFYGLLLDSRVSILLEGDSGDEMITPRVFELEDGPVVLVFDTDERLAEFSNALSPSAELPARHLIRMLKGQGIGLGLNLGVAPSSMLLPPEAVDWLGDLDDGALTEELAKPREITAPAGVPQAVLTALDTKLARAAGLAQCAWLVGVTYETGARGHLLALINPLPGAEETLARAVAEALRLSAVDAASLDTAFFRSSDPVCAQFARVGLRFDLPEPEHAGESAQMPGARPGMDPDKPPRLH